MKGFKSKFPLDYPEGTPIMPGDGYAGVGIK